MLSTADDAPAAYAVKVQPANPRAKKLKIKNTLIGYSLRYGLAFLGLGIAFMGAVFVISGWLLGWGLIALGLPLSIVLALAADAIGPQFFNVLATRGQNISLNTPVWLRWVVCYALLKIPVPLWPEGFPSLGLASTFALFLAALSFAAGLVGYKRAGLLAALAFGVGLAVEVVGSQTGFPFGVYSYQTAPAPLVLGVPLLVPLGWFALTLATFMLSGGRPLLAGLLMVGWDIGLEPLMTAQRFWLWHDSHPIWAGAPIQNFLGWWAVGSGLAWAFKKLAPSLIGSSPVNKHSVNKHSVNKHLLQLSENQKNTPTKGLNFAIVYPIETFFLPSGLVLVGQYTQAAITLLFMLAGLGLAWWVRQAPAKGKQEFN